MALNLDDLAERVSGNLATSTTTTTTDQAAAVAAALVPDYQSEITRLRAENEVLKLERAEQEQSLTNARMKSIEDKAAKPLKAGTSGQFDLAYDRAIRKIGNAKLHQMSEADLCKYLKVEGADQITNETCKRYFGRGSDSAAASSLYRTNRTLYDKLRSVSKIRGIL